MTIPFYIQDELDAAIAKERLWIGAWLRSRGLAGAAAAIEKIDYPRPLVVVPPPKLEPETP